MRPDSRFPQIQGYDLKNKENVKALADEHGMLGIGNIVDLYTEYGATFQLVENIQLQVKVLN